MKQGKHIVECQCHCLDCDAEFFYDADDMENNELNIRSYNANMFLSSMLYLESWKEKSETRRIESVQHEAIANQYARAIRDFDRCPFCRSNKLNKQYREYDIDEFGSYVEGSERELIPIAGEPDSSDVNESPKWQTILGWICLLFILIFML